MKTRYGNVDFNNHDERNEGLAIGLLLGAAIGVCATLVFTQKSGKALREKIKDGAEKQKDKLSKHWDKAKDKADELAGDAKDAAESAGEDAKDTVNDYADQAKDGAKSAMDNFQKKY